MPAYTGKGAFNAYGVQTLQWGQPIEVTAGSTYSVFGRVRSVMSMKSPVMSVGLLLSNGSTVWAKQNQTVASTDWSDVSGQVIIPAGVTSATLVFSQTEPLASFEIDEFKAGDVTAALAMAAQVTAAAGSAQTASTKATEAAQHANAASSSATTASTKASEASTSAGQASAAKSDAESAQAAATTQAGLAVTARQQAEDAEQEAKTAASAAQQSETNAAASATTAGQQAVIASGHANTASTKAGEASTSASQAAQSKTDAAGSASAAASSATLSAEARDTAHKAINRAPNLPSTFEAGLVNWTMERVGSPEAAPAVPASRGAFVSDDPDFGGCLEWSSTATAGQNVMTRGVVEPIGRQFRITVKFKVVSTYNGDNTGPVGVNLTLALMNSAYQSAQNCFTAVRSCEPNGGVYTLTEIVSAAAGSDITYSHAALGQYPWMRVGLRLNESRVTKFRVQSVKIEDVTSELASKASASASADSASSASASAMAADWSAQAASADRLAAQTAKSQAETARTDAVTAKENAESSAAAAAISAGASAASANDAGDSASAASTSAQQAASSAGAAGDSATAAASSATTATTKAGEASTSATQAAQSKDDAAGSASNAATSAAAAATSATQSGESASAAATSASTANTKATEAGQSATTASTAANTATTKAGEASTSATQAAQSKTDAAGSATAAATSATTAAKASSDASALARGNLILESVFEGADRGRWYPYGGTLDVRDAPIATPSGRTRALFSSAGDVSTTYTYPIEGSGVRTYRLQGYVLNTGTANARMGVRLTTASGALAWRGVVVMPAPAEGASPAWVKIDTTIEVDVTSYVLLAPWLSNTSGTRSTYWNDLSIEDVTESAAAAKSATASANSATSASASATDADWSAQAAASEKLLAETARGQAQTARNEAVQAKEDAAISEANAALSESAAAASKNAAGDSAAAAATSASTAGTKATEAEQSATTASTAANTATTKAGEASTSATNAATSASNAAGSASAAASSASVSASARDAAIQQAVSTYPSTFAEGLYAWTSSRNTDPNSTASGVDSRLTFVASDPVSNGPSASLTGSSAGQNLMQRGVWSPAGRSFRVEIKARLESTASESGIHGFNMIAVLYSTAGSYSTGQTLIQFSVQNIQVSDGIVTFAGTICDPAIAELVESVDQTHAGMATAHSIRFGLRNNSQSAFDLRFLSFDVADITNVSKGAKAASTSASAAAASATDAGEKATAAQQSATTATTKAGEASTSATNAATSESNASGSATAAASSAGVAAGAANDASGSATAAANSASAAASKATEAGQSATAAQTAATTAATKAGEASTSATNAATSASNASGSANAAASSATVSATALSTAQQLLNTAKVILPSVPAVASKNFSINNATGALAADNLYGSDTDGPFVQSSSTGSGASVGPAGLLPLDSNGRVYRVTIKFKTPTASRGRLQFRYLNAAGESLGTASAWINDASTPFAADTLHTYTAVLGAQTGGLVTLQVTNANWLAAASLRLAMNMGSTLSAAWKCHEFRVEDVTEADAAARQAGLAAGSATAAATSASSAAASATTAGEQATAAQTSASTATTKAGEAAVSASNAATSESNATGAASSAASSAVVAADATKAAQVAINTPKALLPSIPDYSARNFSNSGLGIDNIAASFWGSDDDGAFVSRSTNNWYDPIQQAGYIPVSPDRVYRFTIRAKFGADNSSFGRLYLYHLSNDRSSSPENTNIIISGAVTADQIATRQFVLGAQSGGLVTNVVAADKWGQVHKFIRFGLSTNKSATQQIFKIYEFLVEDVTEADAAARSAAAAGDSASAAATSAASAVAAANTAGEKATSAQTSATNAATSAGNARTSEVNAATSETNAAGSASTASTQAGLASNSATTASQRATAAANSATTASTKATEAEQSASTASTHATTAQTQAGIATTKAGEAASSATSAAGSASQASSYAQLAALALGTGMARNPVFADWTGAYPALTSVTPGSNGTVSKVTGKYGNAVQLDATGTAGTGPYIQMQSTPHLNGSMNPPRVMITLELEVTAGDPAGMFVEAAWYQGSTWRWVGALIGPKLTVGAGIQTYQTIIEKPAVATSPTSFLIRLTSSDAKYTGARSACTVILHRMDVQEIVADSFVDEQRQVKASLDGITSSSYVMRVKAGGAAAGFEMVAASDPAGSASAIRMSADEIIMDGTVKTPQLAAGSVTASRMAIGDFTNLVPDSELSDSASWNIPANVTLDTANKALAYSAVASSQQVSCARFPVEPMVEYYFQARIETTDASATGVFRLQLRWMAADGSWISWTPNNDETVPANAAKLIQRSAVAPANAAYAVLYLQSMASANVAVTATLPAVRRKGTGELLVNGTITATHLIQTQEILTNSAQIRDAIITDAHVTELSAGKLKANTALTGSLTVNGEALSSVQTKATTGAQDPAVRINSGNTQIDPGKVVISGGTSLLDWRGLSDTTTINGGKLETNSVLAQSVVIGEPGNLFSCGTFEDADQVAKTMTLATGHSVVTVSGRSSGTKALRLVQAGSSFINQVFAVTPGEKYSIRFFANRNAAFDGTADNCKIRIAATTGNVGSSGGTLVNGLSFVSGAVNAWNEYTSVFTVPNGVSRIMLQVMSDNTAGNAWIDDIEVRRQQSTITIADGAITGAKLIATENVITNSAQIKEATIGEAHITGTLSAGILRAGTALAAGITVSGTALSTVASNAATGAQNPATRINSGSTQIDPGKILISGSTTLSNWRGVSDTTAINGGKIETNSISTRSLMIGDWTNLVPDNQLVDSSAWPMTNGAYAQFRPSTELAIKPGSVGYIRFDGASAGTGLIRAHSQEFPVIGGGKYRCGGVAWRQSGDAGGVVFSIQFKDNNGAWINAQNFFNRTYANGTLTGAQAQENEITAPADAVTARVYITCIGSTTGVWVAATPSVRSMVGSVLIENGAITADHLNVTRLDAITATIGTFQSATSGARLVIKDSQILVYDASNVVRVKIGNLS